MDDRNTEPFDFSPMRPGRPRELSQFLFRELIYDYVTGQLDAGRQKAMDDYLARHRPEQDEVEEIRSSIAYCQRLGQASLSQNFLEDLSAYRDVQRRWRQILDPAQWNPFPRWVALATLASGLTLASALLIPWRELLDLWPKRQTQTQTVPPPEVLPQRPVLSKEPPPLAPTAPSAPPAAIAPNVAKPAPEPQPIATPPVAQGLLHRLSITAPLFELNSVSAEIVQLIEKLGGKKAGKVELGWQQTETTRYFHFTLPDSRLEEFLAALRAHGPVRLLKEKHWRIMPQGLFRFILVLEGEKNSAQEEPTLPEPTMSEPTPSEPRKEDLAE